VGNAVERFPGSAIPTGSTGREGSEGRVSRGGRKEGLEHIRKKGGGGSGEKE